MGKEKELAKRKNNIREVLTVWGSFSLFFYILFHFLFLSFPFALFLYSLFIYYYCSCSSLFQILFSQRATAAFYIGIKERLEVSKESYIGSFCYNYFTVIAFSFMIIWYFLLLSYFLFQFYHWWSGFYSILLLFLWEFFLSEFLFSPIIFYYYCISISFVFFF